MIKTNEITEFLPPVRIIGSSETINAEFLVGNAARQVPLGGDKYASVMPKGWVLLDYGVEISGGVRILTQIVRSSVFSAKIRIRFGESATEAMSELGEKNSGNHHSTRDFMCNVQNLSEVRLGSTGFRFVRIDNIDESRIDFLSVQAAYTHSDIKAVGGIVTDDERVNEILKTAERTLFLNMQNGVLWDGVKRDRLVWAGDMYVEILTCLYLYGDVENVRNSLDMCFENVKITGWANTIPSYSLWLALDLANYFYFTGDKEYLAKSMDFIDDLIGKLDVCVGSDGKFNPSAYTGHKTNRPYFIDWQTVDNPDNIYAVEAILRHTLKTIIDLKNALGEDDEKAKKILARAKKRGVKLTETKSLNALQVLFGGATDESFGKSLLKGGADGISTFMSYFVLSAMSEAGYGKEAVLVMKEYFSAMLDLGATTFFEDFAMKWKDGVFPIYRIGKEGKQDFHGDRGDHCYVGFRHSLCHGWASGALPFFTERVLGVNLKTLNDKNEAITPLTGIFKKINGKVATVSGNVNVAVDGKNYAVKRG